MKQLTKKTIEKNGNGIGGITLKWFGNYITNRKQYILISNIENTDLKDFACGVPQGSILGPLFFLYM